MRSQRDGQMKNPTASRVHRIRNRRCTPISTDADFCRFHRRASAVSYPGGMRASSLDFACVLGGPSRRGGFFAGASHKSIMVRNPGEGIMPSFGFTLKPDMGPDRLVDLAIRAEAAGFKYGWSFDSHVLWQEPYPLLTLMAVNTRAM